ncbi:OmpA family protein [Roseovarius sp. E0-M6]|uniref:OmpA family protein n=1 Tax=Roseovarius sp. E0-M6 TaxID=3127118 RepID=UPI00300F7F1A
MTRARALVGWILAAMVTALPARALDLDLDLPGDGTLTRQIKRSSDSYEVPIGPWSGGFAPGVTVKGDITFQAWRLDTQGQSTLSILSDLANQLSAAGYETLLRCAGRECGGFDFRFSTEVLSAPDMFVDLFDYRFLSARLNENGAAGYVTILVSRSERAGYVQIVLADPRRGSNLSVSAGKTPSGQPSPTTEDIGDTSPPRQETPLDADALQDALVTRGHVILDDLEFATGDSALGNGPFSSLEALAAFLGVDPERRVALVGHTDATGGLDVNIALSRDRARAVLERLVAAYDIPRNQLEAQGMGYLSPVAPNLTQAGREANRRVEAVLLNTE